MPRCIKLKRKKRQVCIGDLDTLIDLQDRVITPPESGVDASETFTDACPDIWAKMETGRGQTIFDGTDTAQDVTHIFTIRFIEGVVTAETWIRFKGQRFDIIDVEDLEERNEWLMLRCSNRGTEDNLASEA